MRGVGLQRKGDVERKRCRSVSGKDVRGEGSAGEGERIKGVGTDRRLRGKQGGRVGGWKGGVRGKRRERRSGQRTLGGGGGGSSRP